MRSRPGCSFVAAALLAAIFSTSCGGPQEVKVTAIQVGRSRNADKTIATQTFEFKPSETIYAAVVLEGHGDNVPVTARWSYAGAQVDERVQTLSPRERAVAAFELRGVGGLPSGSYKLEVLLNGTPVGTKELRVKD
jgi:hypothetical protein